MLAYQSKIIVADLSCSVLDVERFTPPKLALGISQVKQSV